MGFRFQRRIKLLPGLRLNVSKSGVSWTVGTRGASVNVRNGKATGNLGIPGTGLSWRERLDRPETPGPSAVTPPDPTSTDRPPAPRPGAIALGERVGWFILALLAFAIGRMIGPGQ